MPHLVLKHQEEWTLSGPAPLLPGTHSITLPSSGTSVEGTQDQQNVSLGHANGVP